MKVQVLAAAPAQSEVGEARPPIGLRVLFLLAALGVVIAANLPIAALATQVVS